MRFWKRMAAALVATYLILTGALWVAMNRPPDTIGQVMKYVPTPLIIVLPFQPLWLHARNGALRLGDAAPDFNLESVDHKTKVHLADERNRPVVLIFGSYT